MTISTKNRLFCTALVLSALQFGLSQSRADDFIFTFGPPVLPVWDVSGTYYLTNHMQSGHIEPLEIVLKDIGLGVRGNGRIEGAGTVLVLVGTDIVGGDYKVSGKMSGGGAKTRANFSVHFKGNGVVAGVSTKCNINVNYKLEINPLGTNMIGSVTGNASFSHLGSGSLKSSVIVALPPGVDGGWTATLSMFPFGSKLSGTAFVQVDNIPPTPLAMKLNGNISKGVAKVKLSGSGNSAGTQLQMEFTTLPGGGTNLLTTVKGKVLGQNVKN